MTSTPIEVFTTLFHVVNAATENFFTRKKFGSLDFQWDIYYESRPTLTWITQTGVQRALLKDGWQTVYLGWHWTNRIRTNATQTDRTVSLCSHKAVSSQQKESHLHSSANQNEGRYVQGNSVYSNSNLTDYRVCRRFIRQGRCPHPTTNKCVWIPRLNVLLTSAIKWYIFNSDVKDRVA